jgi:S1-C subfamily serine protease
MRTRPVLDWCLVLSLAFTLFCPTGASAHPTPAPVVGRPLDGPAGPPASPLPDALFAMPADDGSAAAANMITSDLRSENPAEILRKSQAAIVTITCKLPHEGAVRGTGFFATANDLVVTSNHLVDGGTDLTVRTHDGKEFKKAQVVAANPNVDLAVLKVTDLDKARPFLPMGDSHAVQVGEHVVAIGHPMGLEYTVSDGLVSALRNSEIEGLNLIQFSAPVSPGCSGGPLFDEYGQVIGIICLSHPDGQNLNFAIPINYARQGLDKLAAAEALPAAPATTATASASVNAEPSLHVTTPIPDSADLVPSVASVTVHAPRPHRTFAVDDRGFNLSLPANWTVHSMRNASGLRVHAESANSLIRLDLITLPVAAAANLDDWSSKVVRTLLSAEETADQQADDNARAPQLVRQSTLDADGVNWKVFVHRQNDADGNDCYNVTMVTLKKNQGYVVRYSVPVDQWSHLRKQLDHLVNEVAIF